MNNLNVMKEYEDYSFNKIYLTGTELEYINTSLSTVSTARL